MAETAPSATLVTISSPHHHDTLISGLWHLYTAGHALDSDIQCAGHSIRAHRLVLDIFLSPDRLTHKSTGQSGAATAHIDSVVEFMYTGTVTLPGDQIDNLLAVAKQLDFRLLVEAVKSVQSGGSIQNRPGKEDEPVTRVVTRSRARSQGSDSRISVKTRRSQIKLARDDGKKSRPIARGSPKRGVARTRTVTGLNNESKESDQSRCNDGEKEGKSGKGDGVVEIAGQQDGGTGPVTNDAGEKPEVSEEGSPEVTRHTLWRRRRPMLKCMHCHYQNRCKILFKVHMSKHDDSITVFRCPLCSQAYLDQASLDKHRLKHAEKPQVYRCPHCPYKNRQNSWFQLHLKSKHGTNVAVDRCATCGRPFLTAEAMSRHKCVREETGVHSCPHCEFKTSRLMFYRRHLAKHDKSVVVHRCDMCSQSFLSESALLAHQSAHTAYTCPHCPFDTRKSNVYYHHLYAKHRINTRGETVPEKVKKYKCQDCEYRCVQLSELKIHQTAKHSPDAPFHCQQCSFSSGRKGNVVRHVKWVHLGLRASQLFVCEQCGHKTRTQAKLADHQRRHSTDKPHICEICQKAYKDRTSYKRHVQRHVCDDKPFVCHLCGFSCNRRDNLKGHLKRIHKASMDPLPVD